MSHRKSYQNISVHVHFPSNTFFSPWFCSVASRLRMWHFINTDFIKFVSSLWLRQKRNSALWHPPEGVVHFMAFFHSMWIEMRPRNWQGCISGGKRKAEGGRTLPTRQAVSHPQCFMFWGLSIRMASLILRSWSGQALVTVILWSSDCLGLLGVGWRTTCIKKKKKTQAINGNYLTSRKLGIWSRCSSKMQKSVPANGAGLNSKMSLGGVTEQCCALPPWRGGLISLCLFKELWGSLPSCLVCCRGRSKSFITAKVTATSQISEGLLPKLRQHHLP